MYAAWKTGPGFKKKRTSGYPFISFLMLGAPRSQDEKKTEFVPAELYALSFSIVF